MVFVQQKLKMLLPVVGVSVLMIMIFLWNIFKNTSLGKKMINEFKREAEKTKEDIDRINAEWEERYKLLEDKLENQRKYTAEVDTKLKVVVENIPNKKIKELGEKFYGKETIND